MLPANVLKKPLPGQRLNVIATVHVTDDDVSFYDGPGILIRKTRSRALTAPAFPCEYMDLCRLKHGC